MPSGPRSPEFLQTPAKQSPAIPESCPIAQPAPAVQLSTEAAQKPKVRPLIIIRPPLSGPPRARHAPPPPKAAQTRSRDAEADHPPPPEQPCCVCKEEKSRRDECMLFSSAADPAKDCVSTIDQYKLCMKGFGFEI